MLATPDCQNYLVKRSPTFTDEHVWQSCIYVNNSPTQSTQRHVAQVDPSPVRVGLEHGFRGTTFQIQVEMCKHNMSQIRVEKLSPWKSLMFSHLNNFCLFNQHAMINFDSIAGQTTSNKSILEIGG